MCASLSDFFINSEIKGGIGDRFRARRFKKFEAQLLKFNRPIRILDIGGTECYWENRGFHLRSNIVITLLNLNKTEAKYDHFKPVIGNATDLSDYKEDEFDIVFSNSVIEHLFTWENQQKMAEECQRVGKHHFIQTPNKYFFIEPHYRLPLFNFLPKKIAYFLLTKTPVAHGHRWDHNRATRWLSEIQLLSLNQFQKLFPNSTMSKEKFLGMTKSFTVHNFD
jgi:hypothetical protein